MHDKRTAPSDHKVSQSNTTWHSDLFARPLTIDFYRHFSTGNQSILA
ncbi:unnamed protein product, partial [Rotaria socialis]